MMSFVVAMLKHPHILRKAQEEIDRVVGKERLPVFADKKNLPYVNAVCSEVFRLVFINLYYYMHRLSTVSFSRYETVSPFGEYQLFIYFVSSSVIVNNGRNV